MIDALALFDAGRLDEALRRAEEIIASLGGAEEAAPRDAQAIARALWIAGAVNEADGDVELAWTRVRRAIELYARHRMDIDEIDIRASRELAAASVRLRPLVGA